MWIRTLNGIEFIPMTLTIQGLPITKTNNMAQQTNQVPDIRKEVSAVEWLESKLKETYQKEGHLPLGYILYLTEQAKKIENKQREEEILNAIIFSEKEHFSNSLCYPTQYVVKKAEQYYKDIYGGQGSPDTTTSPTK